MRKIFDTCSYSRINSINVTGVGTTGLQIRVSHPKHMFQLMHNFKPIFFLAYLNLWVLQKIPIVSSP